MLTFLLNPKRRGRRRKSARRRRSHGGYWKGVARTLACRPRTRRARKLRARVCKVRLGKRARAAAASAAAAHGRETMRQKMVRFFYRGKNHNPRRKRARNRVWIPAFRNPADYQPTYSYNPGGGLVSGLTSGFKPAAIIQGASIVGGALANAFVSGQALKMVGGFAPQAASSKIAQVGIGIASAGAVGALARMVAPNYAKGLFTGALAQVVASVISEPLQGLLAQAGHPAAPAPVAVAAAAGTQGINDYLVQAQVDAARRLEGLSGGLGSDMGDEMSF